jgi:hypothetical protein
MDRVSPYYGAVSTSAGEGHVFELIRNIDGTLALTLATWLEANRLNLAEVRAELADLGRYLQREGIIVADLHAGNLVRQEVRAEEFRLVVIDGIGNNEFIKIHDYFRPAARRKARRKWLRFLDALEREWGMGNQPEGA